MERVSVIMSNFTNKTPEPQPPDPPESQNQNEKINDHEEKKEADGSTEFIDTENPTHENLVAFQTHNIFAIQNAKCDAEMELILESMGNRAIRLLLKNFLKSVNKPLDFTVHSQGFLMRH